MRSAAKRRSRDRWRRFPGTVRRWLTDRCEECGHRFHWKRDARHSFGNRDGKVWHSPCIGLVTWRTKAEERLAVIDLMAQVWGINASDVRELMANRAVRDGYESSNAWNLAGRVFYDLDNKREVSR